MRWVRKKEDTALNQEITLIVSCLNLFRPTRFLSAMIRGGGVPESINNVRQHGWYYYNSITHTLQPETVLGAKISFTE